MTFSPELLNEIRSRFAHVDACPFTGERIFFENAGGALTLNTVVETSARFAAIPDNQGRDNAASRALVDIINKAKKDLATFLNANGGQIIVGESGTEMLFRMIRNACMATGPGGDVIGSTLEHPASRSAMAHWAVHAGQNHILVKHDDHSGTVSATDYQSKVTPNTRVATIIHTSPVTGMAVDIAAISQTIRKVAPSCIIIVDGIQHAAHGGIDIQAANIDGYALSPYKMFSRHGFGAAWISDKLGALPHERLINGPELQWELGTRDTGSYATLSDVVSYFEWLGSQVSDGETMQERIVAAGKAIHDHEKSLTDMMLHGTGNLKGLADMDGIRIVGGVDNPAREGLVAFWDEAISSADLVAALNDQNIRVHIRKADHYSGNVLTPLGQPDCIRVSLCHYNSPAEVQRFLSAMAAIREAE